MMLKGAAVLLLTVVLSLALPERANADMTLLKMGWIYNIGFPEVIQEQGVRNGLAPGMNTYRVLSSGGVGWYRIQRVYRHKNGGWFSPPGTPQVWANLGYAYAIREQY